MTPQHVLLVWYPVPEVLDMWFGNQGLAAGTGY